MFAKLNCAAQIFLIKRIADLEMFTPEDADYVLVFQEHNLPKGELLKDSEQGLEATIRKLASACLDVQARDLEGKTLALLVRCPNSRLLNEIRHSRYF